MLAHYAKQIAEAPKLRWIGYLSTIGVYGDHGGAWVDEQTPATPTQPRSRERAVAEQAWLAFGAANPALYRLMFTAPDLAGTHLGDRALAAFGVLLALIERGQAAGAIRRRPVRGQAAACWAQVHGLTMLAIDGLLLPEKVGPDATEAALTVLLEGLQTSPDCTTSG